MTTTLGHPPSRRPALPHRRAPPLAAGRRPPVLTPVPSRRSAEDGVSPSSRVARLRCWQPCGSPARGSHGPRGPAPGCRPLPQHWPTLASGGRQCVQHGLCAQIHSRERPGAQEGVSLAAKGTWGSWADVLLRRTFQGFLGDPSPYLWPSPCLSFHTQADRQS